MTSALFYDFLMPPLSYHQVFTSINKLRLFLTSFSPKFRRLKWMHPKKMRSKGPFINYIRQYFGFFSPPSSLYVRQITKYVRQFSAFFDPPSPFLLYVIYKQPLNKEKTEHQLHFHVLEGTFYISTNPSKAHSV